MMFAENMFIVATRRITVFIVLLLSILTVMAEDVTFMSNRRQWEKLPTLTLMNMGGKYLDYRMMPDSALLCYTIVINRYSEDLNDEDLKYCIRAYHHIGDTYRIYYNNQAEAYKYLLKSKDLAEKHHYDTFMPNIFMTLGSLYWRQWGLQFGHDQYQKEALEYYKAAFWKSLETHDLRNLPHIMINLNYVACVNKELSLTTKERETFPTIKLPDSIRYQKTALAINQAVNLLNQNQPEQALGVFRGAHQFANEEFADFNATNAHTIINNLIIFTQVNMGDPDALKTIQEDIALAQKSNPTLLFEIYGQLSMYYRTFNNPMLAEKYELMWWRASDSIAQVTKANELNNVRFLYELDKMNAEQKALTLKQQHDRKMLWVVSGFLALALGLIVLLVINRGLIKQKNKVLYENNVALLAAEDERRRQAEQEELARVEAEAAKYGAIRMDEQSTEELWQNIIHVMEYSQEIYDENFSVARLAELIEAKSNYVSQAINQHDSKGFPNLLAHYRIQEACRRMNDNVNYKNYTVEGFGQSVGYTSRSHFVKLFKHHTGLTPSDYMKQCRASIPSTLPLSLVM